MNYKTIRPSALLPVLFSCMALLAASAQVPAKAGSAAKTAAAALQEKGNRALDAMPLVFEKNIGQARADASFLSHGAGYSLSVSPAGASFTLRKDKADSIDLHMNLVGANPTAQVSGVDQIAGVTNYLYGKDSSKWITGVLNFQKVKVANALPGIDVMYYGNNRELEYDFDVAPSADPARIALRFDGSRSQHVDADGSLIVATGAGNVRFQTPNAYQLTATGAQQKVTAKFLIAKNGDVTFALGQYDHTQPLVIDPVLSYVTFWSGVYDTPPLPDAVNIFGFATDNSGDSYIYGLDEGKRFGTSTTEGSCPSSGCANIFIIKFDPSKSGAASLVFTTLIPAIAEEDYTSVQLGDIYGFYSLYGSILGDGGNGAFFPTAALAVDGHGNIYFTGGTDNPDYPVTSSAYQSTCNMNPKDPALQFCVPSMYISKLAPDGSTLLYSTYMNSSAPIPAPAMYPQIGTTTYPAFGFAITADNDQKVYVAGYVTYGFPVTNSLPCTGISFTVPTCRSPVLLKLDTTKTGTAALNYSEEFEFDNESAFSAAPVLLATDGLGALYTANFRCPNFETGIGDTPIPYNGYQVSGPAGGDEACWKVIALDTTGAVRYASYFDPVATQTISTLQISGVSADATGRLYIAGIVFPAISFPIVGNGKLFTVSDYPTTTSYGQFVAAFDTFQTGPSSLVYGSTIEGVQGENRTEMAGNGCGSIAVTGEMQSPNFPSVNPISGAIETDYPPNVNPPYAAVFNTKLAGTPGLTFSSSLYTSEYDSAIFSNMTFTQLGTLSMVGLLNPDNSPKQLTDYANFPTANAYQSIATGGEPPDHLVVNPAPIFQVMQNVIPAGCINVAPNAVPFGDEPVGSTTATQQIMLTNTSQVALAITSIVPSTGFTETDNCSTSVARDQSCTVNVAFKPTISGLNNGTLTFTDSDATVTQVVNLAGNGTSVNNPQAVLNPNPFAFANQGVGITSNAQIITLSNPGNAGLNISSISLTGANPADFAVNTTLCPAALAQNASCNISVTFTPAAVASYTALLTVSDNATGSPHTAMLSGTGVGVPAATLSAGASFGSQTVFTAGSTQFLTLTNTGTAALNISSITIGGTDATSFSQAGNSTCGATLATGANCRIYLNFSPTDTVNYTATLTVTDNATPTTQTATLTGTGAAPPTPVMSLAPNPMAFGNVVVGSSATLTLTVSSTGDGTLILEGVSLGGANPTAFKQAGGSCDAVVSMSCTVTYTFTPPSIGNFSAILTINNNATPAMQTVMLTGSGVVAAAPIASLTAAAAFPSTSSGATATAIPLTLSNTGGAPLTISSVTIAGSNPTDFADTSLCGTSLAAGSACAINVTFTPASAATFSATLTVTDNSATPTQTATLTGTGLAVATDFTVVTPTPAETVDPGGVAQFNINVTAVSGNYDTPVTLTVAGLPSGTTASFSPATVTPGSGGGASVLSIQTAPLTGRLITPSDQPWLAALLLLPLLGTRRMRRKLRQLPLSALLLGALALGAAASITGCGAGGYFGQQPQTATLTVTGTSGLLTHSTTVTLTIQ